MLMTFASNYPRNPLGQIVFPEDRQLRQKIFLSKVEHPAKNNLYLLQELVEYLTKPGDTILDPMAGAGSIMYCAQLGRQIVLIEIEQAFVELLEKNRPGFTGTITVLHGDCRKILPLTDMFDAIIFSPPYSTS